ncbi:MAG: riboflavin biosynthesis protein RibF [Alphaproteobacteria bacterium]|jgi:riboflavin kinase/FMN adenylyltransferase
MQVLRVSADGSIAGVTPAAIAIGNFDGLHRGHLAVITAMMEAAAAKGLTPTVLSFAPHPRRYFDPKHPPFYLARPHDKLKDLKELGVERVIFLRFNARLAGLSAEDFVQQLLVDKFAAKHVVTGTNFAFGKNRTGDAATLTRLLRACGASHEALPPVHWKEQVCSSSAVRCALAEGDMARVCGLLGHDYILSARVQHGDKRGRTLGFPTANLHFPSDLLLPRYGVYTVLAAVAGEVYRGVASLGIRPMYRVAAPLMEVHLLGAAPDLYGQRMRVAPMAYLRPEMKFSSPEALMVQMAKDCAAARAQLEGLA